MTTNLSATLTDVQRALSWHASSGMPMTADDAKAVAKTVGVCATYAAILERQLERRPGTTPSGTVVRLVPRLRVVTRPEVPPSEGAQSEGGSA
jgi:hypothetical protein